MYDVKYSQAMTSSKWWTFINGTTEFESFWIQNKHELGSLKINSLLTKFVAISFLLSWIIPVSIIMITNNFFIGMGINFIIFCFYVSFIIILIVKKFPSVNVDMFCLRKEFIYLILTIVAVVILHFMIELSGLYYSNIGRNLDIAVERFVYVFLCDHFYNQ